jgi:hypothetical protein
MMSVECDGKCNPYCSRQRLSSILAKNGWRDAKSGAKGARKSLVILESSFERDTADRIAIPESSCGV